MRIDVGPLSWFGIGCAVFLAAVVYDLSYASYLKAVSERKRFHAASWAVAIYAVGLIGLAGVIGASPWLCLPEAAGLWVGTFIGIGRASPGPEVQ